MAGYYSPGKGSLPTDVPVDGDVHLLKDPCYHVRITFLTKLVSLLTTRKLPPRFNTIPFLTIHDPEADVRDRVSPSPRYLVLDIEALSRP